MVPMVSVRLPSARRFMAVVRQAVVRVPATPVLQAAVPPAALRARLPVQAQAAVPVRRAEQGSAQTVTGTVVYGPCVQVKTAAGVGKTIRAVSASIPVTANLVVADPLTAVVVLLHQAAAQVLPVLRAAHPAAVRARPQAAAPRLRAAVPRPPVRPPVVVLAVASLQPSILITTGVVVTVLA